jgi:phospholipid-binding lipoprotein MlaA
VTATGRAVVVAAALLALGGCASVSPHLAADGERETDWSATRALLDAPEPDLVQLVDTRGGERPFSVLAAARPAPGLLAQRRNDQVAPPFDEDEEPYDPWERFNERMFDFNLAVDRHVLKPVAFAYKTSLPERLMIAVDNGFDNLRFVPRAFNSLLQGKWEGVLRELSRFVLNSTMGIGGLFDAATYAGIDRSREDFGQTLGVWGLGPGPYLVLPLMSPMTVRDGVGRGVDSLIDPFSYLIPFFFERLAMTVGDTVNERALNYDLFEGVEETTIDLYSAVRHFYLERREQLIRE